MNLKQELGNFFKNYQLEDSYDVIVIRTDGINLYSNFKDPSMESTVGALASSLWHAAQTLVEDQSNSTDLYRLAFDTTNSGLYILPLKIKEERFFVCTLYRSKKVPAKIKNEIRKLKTSIEKYFSTITIETEKSEREGFLFSNITDQEMDDLFGLKRV